MNKKFIVSSNISLLIAVFAAAYMREWIYFSIALSAAIASPIYHYTAEYYPQNTRLHAITRTIDWFVAICAYTYMFYYIYTKVIPSLQIPLALCLSATLVFFWYGYIVKGYKKLHPIFHILTSIVSAVIVVSRVG